MFYRENGQFKTSYRADQQIFPITQDRWVILALIAFAFIGVPMLVDEYMFRAIFIPFLIIDMVVASVLMSMGMMMMSPVMVSLPFKLMLFVLVDGWHLLLGSLVMSFST